MCKTIHGFATHGRCLWFYPFTPGEKNNYTVANNVFGPIAIIGVL